MTDAVTIARSDFRNVRRSRILWGVSAIYVAFMALLFYTGGTGGSPDVTQTLFGAVFLTTLLLPLVAIAGSYLAVAGERESNTVRFLLSQPTTRRSVVLGKFISRGLMLTAALALALLVGLGFVAVLYPAFELLAIAKFAGLTLLLVGAYVSVSVAVSSMSSTRAKAIAGAMGFYFLTDILAVMNGFGLEAALRWVLGELLGLGLSDHLYTGIVAVISPASAYMNSTLAIFSPDNFELLQTGGQLPFYLESWFMVAILVAWIVIPLALGALSFGRAEIA